MKPAHTSIMLDTRRALKDGSYPVKLRITYERQRKYYPTPYSLTEEDFAKVCSEKPKAKYKELQISFQAIEQKAVTIIGKLDVFTFESFEKKYLNASSKEDVLAAFKTQIERLQKEGRAGTASSYECAEKSIKTFANKKSLPFSAITPDFLKEYEHWMLTNGKSLTTVGIYLRPLRALYNDAIASGDALQEQYPFGRRKYIIPAGRNVKKALELSDIEKIFLYEPKHDGEARARDLWIFSYLCNGINVKDIARLKFKNLESERITFIRAKTERTSRQNLKAITVVRTSEIDKIIERWGNSMTKSDDFVFPFLEEGFTPEKELARVRNITKDINKYIKRIATAVGIEKNISTYSARHSFSTVLKRAGAPMELISESLGHSDLKTTENYLDSFEDKVKQKYSSALTDFKKH
ncbi:phage integrase SAM-like domain-containing protein [Pontibacter beigongshangensis]|uniref:phage integrase SAM-like domain-containing protein n=1 Tax=Pontibacter beigongshangensis TaxID=2574733 RepID=UPI001650958E|nr:site-specific integrase [Pontibacter beigongshangensis]